MAYSYDPLPNAKSIRLLHVAPGYGNTPLEAYLTTYKLENCCEYEAVSYVWGEPDSKRALLINDRNLKISENLHSILLQLRLSEGPRTLWIDAICINQEDIGEKGIQVALMGQVYQQATTVLCWLGQLTTHRLWALRFLQNLAEETVIQLPAYVWKYQWAPELFDNTPLHGVYADKVVVEAQEAHVETIYESDWFTRLWVVQEAVIAQKPSILCGSFQLSWEEFELATRIIFCSCHQSSKAAKKLVAINGPWEILTLRGKYKLNADPNVRDLISFQVDLPWDVSQIVWRMRFKRCKDDRDRIYALLSLTAGVNAMKLLPGVSIVPDYSKPVTWVYYQFWQHFGGYTSLFWAGLSRRAVSGRTGERSAFFDDTLKTMREDFLPSWVPDLRPPPDKSWSPVFEQHYGTSTRNHHLWCSAPKEGPGLLMIRGHRFDVIERVYPCLERPSFKDTRNRIKFFLSLESEYGKSPNGQGWIEALGSTLLTNKPPHYDHPLQKHMTNIGHSTKLSNKEIQRLWKSYRETFLTDTSEIEKEIRAVAKSQKMSLFRPVSGVSQEGEIIWMLHSFVVQVLQNHCLMITKQGYIGLAPPDTSVGDVVVAYGGPGVPFVVRDTSMAASYELVREGHRERIVESDVATPVSELIGPCYLHGIMGGELINEQKWKKELEWEVDDLRTIPKPTLCLI